MRYLLLLFGLIAASAQGQTPLTRIAAATDLDLQNYSLYPDIESVCGSDWFVISGGWKCVRPTPSGTLEVTQSGSIPGPIPLISVVRGPIAGDRRFLMAGEMGSLGSLVYAFDPVTFAVSELGRLPQNSAVRLTPELLDVDGDGVDELLLRGNGVSAPDLIIGLPGGATPPFHVVHTLPFQPYFLGQFDADPAAELAVVDPITGALRFYDSQTLALEPYAPVGVYTGSPWVVEDWDNDGVDEIAIQGFGDWVALLDPNGSPTPVQLTVAGHFWLRPFSFVGWEAPNSHELAVQGNQEVFIFNPRTGALLDRNSTSEQFGNPPTFPIRRDWDNDGDIDLAWAQYTGSSHALWLLRNGGGFGVLQRQALGKLVAGHSNDGNLVTIESYGSNDGSGVRLRRRNPQTLALLSDAPIQQGGPFLGQWESYIVADLHDQPGSELLQVTDLVMRLYRLDGTLLWTRNAPDPTNNVFLSVVVPDQTCVGAHCRRILALEAGRVASNAPKELRLLDSENGGAELWSRSFADNRIQTAAGLTDLDGDGVPEILYADREILIGDSLVALDGVSRELRWQTEPNALGLPTAVARTPDQMNRLAIFSGFGQLSYLDPSNGAVRRSQSLGPGNCDYGCQISYLRDGETVGQWVVTGLGPTGGGGPILITNRALRWPFVVDGAIPSARGLAQAGTRLVHVSTFQTVYTLESAPDGVFVDEFEGW